jgi:imidazolonepropionase-like amidohydrolase
MVMRVIRTLTAMATAVAMIAGRAGAQATDADSGRFRLHKFAQPIGEERYRVVRDSGDVRVTTSFRFVDRGSPVPLTASWRGAADLTPLHFEIKGSTSRQSVINDAVDVLNGTATIRTDSITRTAAVRAPYFTIAGYSPVVMQELLLQYWERHGRPASLPTLPAGRVMIALRGVDTVTIEGRREVLRRYGIDGLIWGRETVWRTASGQLAALISIDAEFDHFEAVREGYEPALNTFVARAAADGAEALAALTGKATSAAGAFVLVGGALIDGTDAPAVPDAVVVVRDGKIVAAGPRATTVIPADVRRIDIRGKSVLPGLWDMHAHYEQVEWGPIYLAAGVTTVRDVGNELDFIASVRDAVASGQGIGPRLLLAGVIDGVGPFALGVEQADTPERGVQLVRAYHDAHFNQIKIYSSMKAPVLQAITAEAHRLGMTVTGHVPNGMTTYQAIESGMDQINHAQYIVPMMKPVPAPGTVSPPLDVEGPDARKALDFLKAHHTVVDPTLVIFEWSYHPARIPFSEVEPGVLKVAPELRAQLLNTGVPKAAEARAQVKFDEMLRAVGALHRAGIPVVAGTDQVVPGFSLHREIELYVKAGFTPLEAIQAATIVPARVMGLDAEVGTVTVGKRADLIVVAGNPLQHIEDLRNVWLVVSAGRRYDPAPLWRSVGFMP